MISGLDNGGKGKMCASAERCIPLSLIPSFDLTTLRYSAIPRFHSSHSPYVRRCAIVFHPMSGTSGRMSPWPLPAGRWHKFLRVRDAYVTATGMKTGKSQGRLILREISVKCRLCNPPGATDVCFCNFRTNPLCPAHRQ